MDILQIATAVSDGGFAFGIGAGLSSGVYMGMTIMRKQFLDQLIEAILAGEVSIVDRYGENLTARMLLKLLDKRSKKRK